MVVCGTCKNWKRNAPGDDKGNCKLTSLAHKFYDETCSNYEDYEQEIIPQHAPGAKLDQNKPAARFLSQFGTALLEVAKVQEFGANKYSERGWLKVPDATNRYTSAMIRHWLAEEKEILDPETELLHAAHLAWNALARLHFIIKDIDNE